MGRTLAVTSPDGSATSYVYQANTTKVTDPASKWRTATTDARGNITLVTEPDPGGQAGSACYTPALSLTMSTGALQTCYQYDPMEHLTLVTMPRNNGKQTQRFNYNPSITNLTSETQPETGTTSYTYVIDSYSGFNYADNLLLTKTDANGAVTSYAYDAYGRPTTITRSPSGHGPDPCQSTHYAYDINPNHPSTANAWGRLAMSWTGDLDGSQNPVCTVQTQAGGALLQQAFVEDYSYSTAGQISGKAMQMKTVQGGAAAPARTWTETVTYNPDGSPTAVKYPDFDNGDGTFVTNHTVTYGYNALNQVGYYYTDHLTGSSPYVPNSSNAIQGTAYKATGQQYSIACTVYGFNMNLPYAYESRSYNALSQLTNITSQLNGMNLTYNYTAGADNGQIASLTDSSQTVTYTYDRLKRLTAATATGPNTWSQTYGYDGFGNLDAKNGSTNWTHPIDPATNRVSGYCYDGNGNLIADYGCGTPKFFYDIQNRMTGSGPAGGNSVYLYSATNKRVATINASGQETVYLYGLRGEKLATFTLFQSQAPQVVNNVYFAGRLVERNDAFVQLDRLGSVVNSARYLPYGEEIR